MMLALVQRLRSGMTPLQGMTDLVSKVLRRDLSLLMDAPHLVVSLEIINHWQITRSTTVLCVRKDNDVVMVADGQVTLGSQVVKPNVRKIRKINNRVIGGFAGSTADAFALFDSLEIKLEQHPDQILRAAVELAKLWRTDKFLRKLDAVLLVADVDTLLQITGSGDVIEPHDGIMGIGSGGVYALAAARALIDVPDMDAKSIAERSMNIAANACIYTNHQFTWETLKIDEIRQEDARKEQELLALSVSQKKQE